RRPPQHCHRRRVPTPASRGPPTSPSSPWHATTPGCWATRISKPNSNGPVGLYRQMCRVPRLRAPTHEAAHDCFLGQPRRLQPRGDAIRSDASPAMDRLTTRALLHTHRAGRGPIGARDILLLPVTTRGEAPDLAHSTVVSATL